MKSILKRLFTSTLIKNMTTLSLGMIISQGLIVIASPILTRLFTPADFGIQSVFTSISMVITIIFTLQYDMAIVLPKEDSISLNLKQISVKCSIYALVIFVFLTLIVILLELNHVFIKSLSGMILLLSVIYAWILSIERISNYSNIRKKRFNKISFALLIGSVSSTLFNIVTGYIWGFGFLLIVAIMLKTVITIIFQNRGLGEPIYTIFNKNLFIWSDNEKELMKEYSAFPRYRMIQNLLNALSQNMPSLIFASFFNPAIIGFYALARRIIQLPGVLISNALRKIYYQKAAELKNKDKTIFKITLKYTLGLGIGGLIPFGILIIFSEPLFSLIFGAQWAEAGYFSSWLSIWAFSGFINVPAVSIIPVLGLQKENLIFEIILIVTRVISLIIGVIFLSPRIGIIVYSLSSTILNLGIVFWVLRYLYISETRSSGIEQAPHQ